MSEFEFTVFRIVDIGGSGGLEFAGSITVRDDDGNQDTVFNDIESAGPSETNGDQEIVASGLPELSVGDTIRTRGVFRFTNNETGETYDVIEVFSETAGNPIESLFIFTSTAPDWLFDGTSRSLSLLDADGTIPFSAIVCFCSGTLIRTADGRDVPVETLTVGDEVLTWEGEKRPVRWIGRRDVSATEQMIFPNMRPVCIRAGALGKGLPEHDLCVSPQHRVLISSKIVTRVYGVNDVLVPAKKLVGLDGIHAVREIRELCYWHLLLDDHEILVSNGAPTESLFTGSEALKALPEASRDELEILFPELFLPEHRPVPARRLPGKGRQVNKMIARHAWNGKALISVTA